MHTTNLKPLKRKFFVTFTILFPFLVIVILELVMQAFSIGPDISLFKEVDINGHKYFRFNTEIGRKYFPGTNVQIQCNEMFDVRKDSGTIRIFCLGGSTVTGYPYYYNASFPSFLRERLFSTFPGINFEVINLGMTAINSYMVLDMAEEIMQYQPDLIIVYDGHNEFYGPLGVASQQSVFNSRWSNLLYLKLLHSRIFLQMRDGLNYAGRWLNGNDGQNSNVITLKQLANGQYIPYQGKLYKDGLKIFGQNLESLTDVCMSNNIPLILSTQVSNLRDQVPFISGKSSSLSGVLKEKINKLLLAGDIAGSEGRVDVAMKELEQILSIDSLHAAAHFGIAGCLDIIGNKKDALTEYKKARDYDELRFRAASDFNEIILSMKNKKNVAVADIEKVFMAYSPDSLIGSKLILEHLHPNSYGQFLIAGELSAAIKQLNLIKAPFGVSKERTSSDSILWADRCVSELDERIASRRTEIITSAWPFVENDIRVKEINQNDTLSLFAEYVAENKWGWGDAHVAAIEFYKNKNDLINLEREYKVMISLLPDNVNSYIELASFYLEHKRFMNAKQVLIRSMLVERTDIAEKLIENIERLR